MDAQMFGLVATLGSFPKMSFGVPNGMWVSYWAVALRVRLSFLTTSCEKYCAADAHNDTVIWCDCDTGNV